MNDSVKLKKFNFSNVKGLSSNQLKQHYQLYKGYVNKINEIWSILDSKTDFKNPNSTYSEIRSLKLGESYSLDGVKLHELYFENLGGHNNAPYGEIKTLIDRDFGSYKNFITRLKDVGLSMRGWAVLAIEPIDQRLHVFGQDAHDVGAIWKSHPLLVLDVYEHAYMIDFGIDRKEYIDIFIDNIDWKVVNKRLRMFYKHHNHLDL
ncbi:superoxide dismutase [Dethiothermospora halolimnae]|uniref:superoxide dismutase n=1 Tax=Dethiothermospora halolimnae TaxID=3114390 RepID=UPI003CCB95F5